jgi:GH15 family glucan-1,4-alpha-glucosidase
VYTLSGAVLRSQHESSVAGYRGSSPAHIGNQAGSQLQLGGFGDLIQAVWNYTSQGHRLPASAGARLADMGDLLCRIWRHEDAGLWELGESADYASSKIGCWTAFARLVDLAEAGVVPDAGAARWRRERDSVGGFIDSRLVSAEKRSLLMRSDSDALDCATLLAARRGFLDADDTRLHGTIDAIRAELAAGGPLLYRYSGMREQENAFLACSFWLVESLAIAGRVEEAATLLDELAGCANDVGLYSEELQPENGELRGNFPQALSHLSLIRAAVAIAERG